MQLQPLKLGFFVTANELTFFHNMNETSLSEIS